MIDECKRYTGSEPSPGVYLGAFVACAQKGYWNVAERIFETMRESNVQVRILSVVPISENVRLGKVGS